MGLSASYVNQIEHDVRPLTVPVLLRITDTFGVDATFFSRDDDSRLLAEVQDVVMDKEIAKSPMDLQEISEMVRDHPDIARIMVDIHRRYRNVTDKLSLATEERNFGNSTDTASGSQALTMPHEEVRDYFMPARTTSLRSTPPPRSWLASCASPTRPPMWSLCWPTGCPTTMGFGLRWNRR